ncbi:chemotaxis protein CheA [Pseudodesulfovibrio sediminis]|uniref:Chemotaxis protein CheA n=1 Tax=Pseudodesulfovibrio sediminis TaxID=2810563 RepID=A0ABN6EP64_9BACT|nr:chemotaxis protein CheA [Pseudodesulfovibrio sediminis]BCS86973.1 chemotaxis protein CheA [Pseudodesulfovibrio sediminis]
MSDDLNRQIFKEEAYDLLRELEGALLELEEAPEDMDLVNQIFRALHTIKGSGSMFGFEDIANFTHELETVFDMVRNGDIHVTPVLCSLSLQARDQIRSMLESEDEDNVDADGVDSGAMEAILQGLKDFVAGTDESEAGPEEGEDASDVSVAEESEEVSKEQTNLVQYAITLTPTGEGEVDATSVETFFEELEILGELETLSRHADTKAGWELALTTDANKENVEDVFLFLSADVKVTVADGKPVERTESVAGEEPEAEVTDKSTVVKTIEPVQVSPTIPPAPLVSSFVGDDHFDHSEVPKIGEILVESGDLSEADLHAALKRQKDKDDDKPLGQILAEEGKIAPEGISKAVKKQGEVKEQEVHKKRQEALSSIRVAADKLDYLVDLVGELVIVQAQITQVVSERKDPAMTLLAEELERLSDELRDSTLGIRMLPIGTSFSKFRRLVRDLSADLGKQIGLSTSGAETELDKTVIERLGDPLVHLLRNSIGHGIELPEVREANGKPPQGNILLSAEHSGGEVLIRITDDGKGMSSEMIREKGIERGLIAKDTELTEKELLKLIFEPGFSTAKEVTNVSGRGVGMDVVKRAIDSLRGTIDIDSKPGTGTTITIRLPLTLAIIDGLQVQVGDEFYVIPLSLVEECVELVSSDVDDDTDQKILHLRGEIVPYIHIREWFEVEGDNPPIEQIVITGVEGSRIGIVVDTVIGEHQTVIKSLGRVYKDVEGISGATIKGDGSIALILDVPSLVRRVISDSQKSF